MVIELQQASLDDDDVLTLTIWQPGEPPARFADASVPSRCVECSRDLSVPLLRIEIDPPGKRATQWGLCSEDCATSYISRSRAYLNDGWELELAGEAPAYDLRGDEMVIESQQANHDGADVVTLAIWRPGELPAGFEETSVPPQCVHCGQDLPESFLRIEMRFPVSPGSQGGLCSADCATIYISGVRLRSDDDEELRLAGEAPTYDLKSVDDTAPRGEAAEAIIRLAVLAGVSGDECLMRILERFERTQTWELSLAETARRLTASIERGEEPEW